MEQIIKYIQQKYKPLSVILYSSLKERLEENKRIVAERERENARCRNHD